MYMVHRGLNARTATPERLALLQEIRETKSLLPVMLGTRGVANDLPEELEAQRDKIQERIGALESDSSGAALDTSEPTRFQEALDAFVAEVQDIRSQLPSSTRSARAGKLLREDNGRGARDVPTKDQMSSALLKRRNPTAPDLDGPRTVSFDRVSRQVFIQ
jgi:hypothetical protein